MSTYLALIGRLNHQARLSLAPNRLEYPQEVAADNPATLFGAVATPYQPCSDVRESVDLLNLPSPVVLAARELEFRVHPHDLINVLLSPSMANVQPHAHMLPAYKLHGIVNVVQVILDCRPPFVRVIPQEVRKRGNPHDALSFGNCLNELISYVPPVVTERTH